MGCAIFFRKMVGLVSICKTGAGLVLRGGGGVFELQIRMVVIGLGMDEWTPTTEKGTWPDISLSNGMVGNYQWRGHIGACVCRSRLESDPPIGFPENPNQPQSARVTIGA